MDFGLRLQANDGAMLDLQGLLTSDEQVAIITVAECTSLHTNTQQHQQGQHQR